MGEPAKDGAKEEQYKMGKIGTEDCPEGYRTISEAECKKAGEEWGLKFYGTMGFPDNPKSCVAHPGHGIFYNTIDAKLAEANPERGVVCAKEEATEREEPTKEEPAKAEPAKEEPAKDGAKEEQYRMGKIGTEDCPEGYRTISEAECKKAGEEWGLKF